MKITITDIPDMDDINIEDAGKFILITSESKGLRLDGNPNLEFLSFASKRLNYEVDRKLFTEDSRNKKED